MNTHYINVENILDIQKCRHYDETNYVFLVPLHKPQTLIRQQELKFQPKNWDAISYTQFRKIAVCILVWLRFILTHKQKLEGTACYAIVLFGFQEMYSYLART